MAKYKIYARFKWKARKEMGEYHLLDFFWVPIKQWQDKGWRPTLWTSKEVAKNYAEKFYNGKYIEYKIKKVWFS